MQSQLHFLQVLIDAIPTPIFYKDVQGVLLGCNQAYEVLTGLTKAQIIGRSTLADLALHKVIEDY